MPNPRRRSSIIEAHDVFTKYHRHHPSGLTLDEHGDDDEEDSAPLAPESKTVAGLSLTESVIEGVQRGRKPSPSFPMFHNVMKTGVIYATTRAKSNGFSPETEDEWAK